MTIRTLLLSLLLVSGWGMACGEEETAADSAMLVKGLSVYGSDRESEPPIIVRDSVDREGKPVGMRGYITIQFDVAAPTLPSLKIRFAHCDRDWHPDDNIFVQDDQHNVTFTLNYKVAPGGVRNYTYRFINRFPDPDDVIRFTYSGNWIFQILDEDGATVIGEGRFFVVDQLLRSQMEVVDDYLTANASPLNQIHRVNVRIPVFNEMDAPFITVADIYQNRRFYNPYRIAMDDRDPYTTVEGFGQNFRLFSISNIYPGNEYRSLDLTNLTRYPNWMTVRLVEGPDQPRMFWQGARDRNGTAMLNRYTGLASDYLDVLFRLDLTETDRQQMLAGGRALFVVGPFNQWKSGPEDQMSYDPADRVMAVHEELRRGVYDYQYITGVWDGASATVRDQDWVVVEGNDWRTSDVYTAFVYYHDPRLGGFDRIVAMTRGTSVPPTH